MPADATKRPAGIGRFRCDDFRPQVREAGHSAHLSANVARYAELLVGRYAPGTASHLRKRLKVFQDGEVGGTGGGVIGGAGSPGAPSPMCS